jgi:tetratricopeptide (TPR) repeat protein
VQEVAYAQIAERERAEKHRLVARWLHSLGRPEGQAELLAHHYVSALELVRACGGDDRPLVAPAREALRDAGDRALALNAFAAAASAYARALELWPRGDDELPRLRLRHGQALHCVGDEHAVDVLERAHRELTDAGERDAAAEADAVLAEALWLRGQRDRAFAHLGRARQVVRHAAATPLKTRVLAVHGRFQTLAGDNETGRSSAAEALALADELGLAELQAHALNTIGLAKSNVGEDGWLDDLERSVAIAKAADAREAIRAVNNLASLVSNEGDLGRAHELWRETRTLAERFGDRQFVRFVDGTLVWVDYVVGNWTAAMRAAFEFVAECEAGSPHYQESGVRATRALIRHMRGDAEGALEDTAIGLSLAREVKDPQVLLGELGARARICGELGRDDEARELMDEALAAAQDLLAARQGAAGELIWVADRLGRRREVRELLAAPPPSRWNQAALAVVDGDFPRAADCYAEIGAHTFAACARLRAAIRLFEEERRSAAETELRPALEFFRTVGATRYIAQAETLLAALV